MRIDKKIFSPFVHDVVIYRYYRRRRTLLRCLPRVRPVPRVLNSRLIYLKQRSGRHSLWGGLSDDYSQSWSWCWYRLDLNVPAFSLALAYTQTLGANPSAEEQEEALEEGAAQVNNVVHSFRLQSTSFDKKSYLAYLKVAPFPCFSDDIKQQVNTRGTWRRWSKNFKTLSRHVLKSLRRTLLRMLRKSLQISRTSNSYAFIPVTYNES